MRDDHPAVIAWRDPDCAGCDPFNGLPGYPLQAHTCKAHGPSRPVDRPRYAGEDPADYSLRAEMGER